jgi:hypothetical protein
VIILDVIDVRNTLRGKGWQTRSRREKFFYFFQPFYSFFNRESHFSLKY